MIAPHRQLRGAGCTASYMAPLLVSFLWATAAVAEVDVQIVVESDRGSAPAHVTLTASASSDDPIIRYRWSGLDVDPSCDQERCTLEVFIASCRRVAIEVTTVFGERAEAQTFVCINGGNGSPPRAELRIEPSADKVWAIPAVTTGSDAVALTRLWIDGAEVKEDRASIPADRGCHSIDLLVADNAGRVGIDRRMVCQSAEAPRAQLSAKPDFCPPRPIRHAICGTTDHPLGLPVERVAGDAPFNSCDVEEDPPPSLKRRFVLVRDSAGLTSSASLLTCSAPMGGDTLFFTSLPSVRDALIGQPYLVQAGLHGGRAPYDGTASLLSRSSGVSERVSEVTINGVFLDLSWDSIRLPAGDYTLTATITDADGFVAHAAAELEILSSFRPDAGVSSPQTSDGGFGCATTRSGTLLDAMLLGALALFFSRRRR